MARFGWAGLRFLGLTPRQETVACVLSGGGSRASFQLGVLDWLYQHDPSFTPNVFVGTSAGAILAANLAQGSDRQAQEDYNRRLVRIWSQMKTQDEMFTSRPWLRRAQTELSGLLELVDSPSATPSGGGRSPRFPFRKRAASPSSPPSPPRDPLELALTPDVELPPSWSFGDVVQLLGHVGKLPKLGTELATIRNGIERTRSLYRPGPVLANLLDPEVFDPERVTESGNVLRIAMVALESGELRYLREDGRLTDRHNRVLSQRRHPLATGVLASCSIPAVFRPVTLGKETYVDGGVRDNLPAEMAVCHLHAERTYVASSQPLGVPAKESMADSDLISVVTRSTEIMIDESGRDKTAWAHAADATVIAPEVNVHGAMAVHPGLIRINMDYGRMRAAEVILKAGEDQAALTRRIIRLRMRALELEEELGPDEPPEEICEQLSHVKHELRDAVGASGPEFLPAGAASWWRSFEDHAEELSQDRFWLD